MIDPRTVHCPDCKAVPGEPCIARTLGRPRYIAQTHQARVDAILEAPRGSEAPRNLQDAEESSNDVHD